MSMLSACAGSPASGPVVQGSPDDRGYRSPSSYAEAVEAGSAEVADEDRYLLERAKLAAAHRADERRYDRDRHAHFHEEPSPEQKAIAESVLLLTGAAFVCTFVVVVLNGACNFGVQAGYYY